MNYLGQETSPYLLQHKDNPVDWMPWGSQALERAQAESKPILLSVGYAACHWCHVMAHESFEDPEIAAVMNRLFVNIKVDREERPDLDVIYQAALQMMGEHGGWPLTMFLTPAGEPFWGGTYFPSTPRYGRPGFPQILQAISEAFQTQPDKVDKNVQALREGLSKLGQSEPGAIPTTETLHQVADRLLQLMDPIRGGIKGAPKFPQCGILEQLWRAWKRSGQTPFRDAVLVGLNNMSQGGIYDHLGGGFARYSVDEMWLAPHFEKMLYDNASLIELLALIWSDAKNPMYRQRVEETIDWCRRDMILPGGGFASSFDADSEGEEGRFYVWNENEIDAVLKQDASAFKSFYDVSPEGNWEGKTILNRLNAQDWAGDEAEAALAAARQKLLLERNKRVWPGQDDKVLADWNGMMIAALANAAFAFKRADWMTLATTAFDFVTREMAVEGSRLQHAWRNGVSRHAATLDDYAHMMRAAITLYETSGDMAYLEHCKAWLEVLDRHYADPAGGYFLTADDTTDVITRTKSAADNPNPSGNGTLAEVFARLFYLTGTDTYRQKHDALVEAFSGEIERNLFPLSTLLNAVDLMQNPVQLVIAESAPEGGAQLRDAIRQVSAPNRILIPGAGADRLEPSHPAYGKGPVDGHAAAYICRGMVCSAPIQDPETLRAELAGG